jgi:hypothetical protein
MQCVCVVAQAAVVCNRIAVVVIPPTAMDEMHAAVYVMWDSTANEPAGTPHLLVGRLHAVSGCVCACISLMCARSSLAVQIQ